MVLPWREIAQESKASASRWLTLELGQQTNPLLHPVDKSLLTRSSIRKLKFRRCPQDTAEKLAANEFFQIYRELYPQQAREHEDYLAAQGLAMTANAKCSRKQAKCSRNQIDAQVGSMLNSRAASEAQSIVAKTSNPDGAGVAISADGSAYDTEFAMALSELTPTDELTAQQLQSESFQQLQDEVASGYSAISADEVSANGFAGGVDEVVTDFMEGSGVGNIEKDWMPGGSGAGAGAGSVDGGQSRKGKGGAPETKKGGKKGRRKICAKDGCGARIDESKRCSRCSLVYYCSRVCQKSDWKVHKPKCNVVVEEKAAQDERAKMQSSMRAAAKGISASCGIRTSENAVKDAEEEECPICFDLLVDPLSPCPEQLSHRCCRVCVEKMREHGLPACPLCRAPMQNAEELFYPAMQLCLQARRAVGEAKADLQRQCFDMMRRVLEVDPHCAGAQCNLGVMFQRGEGVGKDAVQAVHWYRKAAVQEYAVAQHNLGGMYDNGKGVKKDAVQAVHWYRKAAVQEYAEAQYNLGLMYEEGGGVKKDAVQAVHWLRKAAVQGLTQAQCSLGIMYHVGEGVGKDAVQAVSWFRKAAVQGKAQAQCCLANQYKNGEGVKKDAVQAVSWWLKAAEQGYAEAQYELGRMYLQGEGVQKDAVQAVHWWQKGAEQGYAVAQCNLGAMYGKGEGVEKDLGEAVRWWQKAADQGQVNAHYYLGQLDEQQGEYQAAILHYRAGQAASPEKARNGIRRCVGAVARAKREEKDRQWAEAMD
jgi:TPR repeat protein